MLDLRVEIEVEARPASTGGILQKISVRWPTDMEWAARQRARKHLIRNLGRGRTERVPPDPGPQDITLFTAMAQNGAPQLTAAEAAMIIDAMAQCDVNDVKVDGTSATVSMETFAGPVTHEVQIPTADQVHKLRRAAVKSQGLPYNQEEYRILLEPGARLYDECGGKSTDYLCEIPAIHKDSAIRSVIEYIDNSLGPKRDDASF